MIIKLTSHESDFIHYYLDFCIDKEYYAEKRGGFSLRDNLFTKNEGRLFEERYSDDIRKTRIHYLQPNGDVHNKWKKTDPEYNEIIDEIKRQWTIYAKDNNIEHVTCPHVSIQYSLTEKDENGECLYYFTCTDQCIVM